MVSLFGPGFKSRQLHKAPLHGAFFMPSRIEYDLLSNNVFGIIDKRTSFIRDFNVGLLLYFPLDICGNTGCAVIIVCNDCANQYWLFKKVK